MIKKISISVIVIIALLALVVLYFQKPEPVNDGPIKVGVITPLTGQYAFLGEGVKNAISLVLGDKEDFELFFEDSAFDAKIGLSAYQKLVDIDKVDVVLNVDSVTLGAVRESNNNSDIPLIQIFESNFHEKDNVFQILPFSYPLFTDLAKAASDRYPKIALIYSGTADIYISNADYFRQGADSDKIAYEAKLGANPSYNTEVSKLLASDPDAVTVIMAPEEGIKFIKSLINQGASDKLTLICDANIEISIGQYIDAVGADIFEDCLSTNLPDNTTDKFANLYKKEFKSDPPFGSAYAYDAAKVVEELVYIPQDRWLSEIGGIKLDGASGRVSFDDKGTRSPESELHIFKNGKFVKLEE